MTLQRAAVIGTTRWGTTLALLLARKGIPVTLLTRTEEEAAQLAATGENTKRLPGFPFPPNLTVASVTGPSLEGADLVVLAVPSTTMRANLRQVKGKVPEGAVLLSATKGLERETGKRMSEIVCEELGEEVQQRIAVLSGPNLSWEVAKGLPTSTVVATQREEIAQQVQEAFTSRVFRVYTNADVVGVELGGTLKNIVALGAGMADGMGFGDNGKAAFIARGMAENTRLGVAAGAKALTFLGLSGLGDLMATCYSPLSRNRYVGQEIGKGRPLADILAKMNQTAEGVHTTPAAIVLARRLGVEMPIAEATNRVLFEGLDPREALEGLLARAPRPEDPLAPRPPTADSGA
ncbi:MAG: NAD(P)-dependent glycerol-3-phosphate dehydrogenase [Chloroflexi bacterium]|nr:NAD(P)-dependent glycerol-3-phosphate dehydrogenase [Chloroflexota bacterium]